ncbi:MAG: hypothetical protein LBG92_06900 [Prevotellaceae bacterium]|nr:hypothetical protein [Prevotellaceae bacterium]
METELIKNNEEIRVLKENIGRLKIQHTQNNEEITVRNGNQTNPNQQTPQQTNNVPQQANNNPSQDSSLYFASKYDKTLTGPLTSSLDANFRVYDVNENEGKFECIGQVGNPNWFERICEIDTTNGIGNTQIITTQAGKVRKEGNNWVVITPAKIKFE